MMYEESRTSSSVSECFVVLDAVVQHFKARRRVAPIALTAIDAQKSEVDRRARAASRMAL